MHQMRQRYIDILFKAATLCALIFALGNITLPAFAQSDRGENVTANTVQHAETERPESLFDIRLSLDKNTLTDTEYLNTRVEFVSFGRVPTTVGLTWTVLDTEGVEVYRAPDETLVVETELTYPRAFVDMSKLTVGDYTVRLTTRYKDDVVDTFEQPFRVIEQKDDIIPFLIIGFMAVVLVGWTLHFIRHHRGYVTHAHIVGITSRAMVFLIAGAVLPTAGLLMSESMNVATQRSTVSLGSLGIRTVSDTSTLLHEIEGIIKQTAFLTETARTEDDTVVYDTARELPQIMSLYSVSYEHDGIMQAHRKLGFAPIKGSLASLPHGEGLVQGDNGEWSVLVQFPRAAGGFYIAQFSVDAAFTSLGMQSRNDEDIFFVNDAGVVITNPLHDKKGDSIPQRFPNMWEQMRIHEYYEGVCDNGRFCLSRRIAIPTGNGYEWYYLVIQGPLVQEKTTADGYANISTVFKF